MAAPIPQRRVERVPSMKNPKSTFPLTSSRPKPPAQQECCSTPDIQEVDGNRVCISCGNIISDSHIVSDVTFGETSTGAAVVQGGYVAEGQRHAKSMGSAFRRVGGGTESREQTEYNGRDELRKLAAALHVPQAVEEQAFTIYRLAAANNFIQGRRTRTVAAACLYVACRRNENNTVLLMDLAEKIQVNVFKLGDVYKELMKDLWLGEFVSSCSAPAIEVEHLIEKFTRKLEFGDRWLAVATDAAKILKRMKRDWMVEGRQPAGLCGACIILAARMNNFRRTVREVVYVVKAADATISERIEEFKRTQGGRLTVKRFREIGENLKTDIVPPSVYKRKAREQKRKRFELIDGQQQIETEGQTTESAHPRALRRPRLDADGFAVPDPPSSSDQPIDPHLLAAAPDTENVNSPNLRITPIISEDQVQPKRRGRKKRTPLPRPREEDLIIEEAIENEIEEVLRDPDVLAQVSEESLEKTSAHATATASRLRPSSTVRDDVDIASDEFDSDPEVANCLLTPAEIAIKERIWVTENEEWMRQQQAKVLQKALEEASGVKKRPQRRRKRGRMGDKSVLEGQSPDAGTDDAVQRMLQKRGKADFSKHINYENLKKIYGQNPERRSASATSGFADDSRRSSVASEVLPTPSLTQHTDRGGEEDAEVIEENDNREALPRRNVARDETEEVEEIIEGRDNVGRQPVFDTLRSLGVDTTEFEEEDLDEDLDDGGDEEGDDGGFEEYD